MSSVTLLVSPLRLIAFLSLLNCLRHGCKTALPSFHLASDSAGSLLSSCSQIIQPTMDTALSIQTTIDPYTKRCSLVALKVSAGSTYCVLSYLLMTKDRSSPFSRLLRSAPPLAKMVSPLIFVTRGSWTNTLAPSAETIVKVPQMAESISEGTLKQFSKRTFSSRLIPLFRWLTPNRGWRLCGARRRNRHN